MLGSPPPMRGKVAAKSAPHLDVGITPAYAGKRNIEFSKRIKQQGSPPPMRGKVYSFGNVKDQVGITPAYAGKRSKYDIDGFRD